jgi:hypothetical protein
MDVGFEVLCKEDVIWVNGPYLASFTVGPCRVVSEMECADRVAGTCHNMHFIQRMHKYFKWKRFLVI